MKLPNGYGSVYKLSGKRRKPWAVSVTQGWELVGGKEKQIRKIIGYYENRIDALNALANYNTNPYDLDAKRITFTEVYEKWSAPKFETISHSNMLGYIASYKVCESLYDMPFADIKTMHLQHVVDTCGKNYPTLRKLKVLFGQMYEYAMVNDITSKDYSKFVDIGKKPVETKKKHFSPQEVDLLWKAVDGNEYLQIILMLIYSGVRISELLELKSKNVHLDERWFLVEKSKTDAGVRRVPIAEKVYPFFAHWISKDTEYLLSTPTGGKLVYRSYYDTYWKPLLAELDINQTPHATRHTTISMLATAKVDQTMIKKIVGHSGTMSLTEKVYTHFDMQPLIDAINSI